MLNECSAFADAKQYNVYLISHANRYVCPVKSLYQSFIPKKIAESIVLA